jgi:AraC-like DNA-binding protein
MYRELSLLPELAGAVEAAWVRDVPPGPGEAYRILPDGCTDLMWVDGALVVAGPDTGPHVTDGPAGSGYVAVRFAPGAGPTILGTPADELRDGRIPLEAMWPASRVRALAGQLADAPDGSRPAVLQAAVLDRLRETGPPDPVTAAVAARQWSGESVAATADALGLSERQLHRRSLAAFGYGPKQLARILRFRRAVALARGGTPFAEVAVRAGYADQAHLAREVRALAGVPLRALMR